MNNDLSQLRTEIDALDVDILKLLNARASLARKVGSLKVRLKSGRIKALASVVFSSLSHISQRVRVLFLGSG